MCKILKENIKYCSKIQPQLCFLKVTFDLKSGTYYPYRRQSNKILFIYKQLNHPPSTINQIPSKTSKRVLDMPCDSDHFNKVAPDYITALTKVVSMKI